MTVYDVVKKLIGEINPIGETNEDARRFENLEKMVILVDTLIGEIDKVAANNKNRQEYSLKKSGQFADKYLKDDLGIA